MTKLKISVDSIYKQWGFDSSPFQTTSLPPNAVGARLLTGRDTELLEISKRIVGVPKFATVEGLNGVGKTSIVNVAAHILFQQHFDLGEGPLFIPCRKIFQLQPGQDLESFIDDVLYEVAQTLIEKAKEIKNNGADIKTKHVRDWLNSPQLSTYQGGIQLMSFGISGGKTSETNTSKGFDRSGFRKTITHWLETVFPTAESGGVICTIDNLELLQSSEQAKAMVEQLRDVVLNMPGLRWVLCGALGIVYGVVASPRLEGYLHKPIVVGEIDEMHAPDILKSRINAYATMGTQTTLPLLPTDFAELYKVLHGILRSVLSYADDFCSWVDEREQPVDDEQRHKIFVEWLAELSGEAYLAIHRQLRPTALRVFKHAISIGGVFSPSDYSDFGFKGIPQFRPSIKDLEDVGLLVSTRDDGDKRRKTIQITAKGWLTSHYLQNMNISDIDEITDDDASENEM